MTDLGGTTALVTGATSGIKATAITLAARSAHVLVMGRSEQRAQDVITVVESNGGSATFCLTTLDALTSVQDLVRWSTKTGNVALVTSTSSSTTRASR